MQIREPGRSRLLAGALGPGMERPVTARLWAQRELAPPDYLVILSLRRTPCVAMCAKLKALQHKRGTTISI